MKSLFYLEPHPIRNELTHYRSILLSKWGKYLSNWIRSGQLSEANFKIACHHFSYTEIIKQYPELIPFVIPTTAIEESKIQSNLKNWDSNQLKLWACLMMGEERPEFHVYKSFLNRIKNSQFDFSNVITWGLNKYIAIAAEELGAQTFSMELSTIRNPFPRSVYIDSDGVNGLASAAKLDLDFVVKKSQALNSAEYLFYAFGANPLKDKNCLDLRSKYLNKNEINMALPSPKSRNILVPLQIADDSNIIVGSQFKNCNEFVIAVCEAFKFSDYNLYFKPHPGAYSRGGLVLLDHLNAYSSVDQYSNCYWMDGSVSAEDYMAFLNKFDAVITINSSVGFEAMLLGIPSFPIGNAIYKPAGYNYSLEDIPCLSRQSLREVKRLGHHISKFLINTVFMSEEKLANDCSLILDRISNFRNSSSIEDYYSSYSSSSCTRFWK